MRTVLFGFGNKIYSSIQASKKRSPNDNAAIGLRLSRKLRVLSANKEIVLQCFTAAKHYFVRAARSTCQVWSTPNTKDLCTSVQAYTNILGWPACCTARPCRVLRFLTTQARILHQCNTLHHVAVQ